MLFALLVHTRSFHAPCCTLPSPSLAPAGKLSALQPPQALQHGANGAAPPISANNAASSSPGARSGAPADTTMAHQRPGSTCAPPGRLAASSSVRRCELCLPLQLGTPPADSSTLAPAMAAFQELQVCGVVCGRSFCWRAGLTPDSKCAARVIA